MSKNNVFIKILLVSIFILLIGGFIFVKLLLPRIMSSVLNTSMSTTLDSLKNIDFSNAKSMNFEQDLSNNKGMFLQISLNRGHLYIDGNSMKDSISGDIKYIGTKPALEYETDENKLALYTIKSTDQVGDALNINLSKLTNGRLDIGIGSGIAEIDLREVDIPFLNVGIGAGSLKVTFSDKKSTKAVLSSGLGYLDLVVPNNVGKRITFEQGVSFSDLQLGESYIKTPQGFETKDYETATVQIDITIGQAVGGFSINTY